MHAHTFSKYFPKLSYATELRKVIADLKIAFLVGISIFDHYSLFIFTQIAAFSSYNCYVAASCLSNTSILNGINTPENDRVIASTPNLLQFLYQNYSDTPHRSYQGFSPSHSKRSPRSRASSPEGSPPVPLTGLAEDLTCTSGKYCRAMQFISHHGVA
jgi:hypothetical protein